MWLGQMGLVVVEKKPDGILLESSENWYAIHPYVFKHETNLGFVFRVVSDAILTKFVNLLRKSLQNFLSRFGFLAFYNGNRFRDAELSFEVGFVFKHLRMYRMLNSRRFQKDLMRFFSAYGHSQISVRDLSYPHD